jgi:hypothetical protein
MPEKITHYKMSNLLTELEKLTLLLQLEEAAKKQVLFPPPPLLFYANI